MIRAAIGALLLLFGATAHAEWVPLDNGDRLMFGDGDAPCSLWNALRDTHDEMILLRWAKGFVTGVMFATNQPPANSLIHEDFIGVFISTYCLVYPKHTLVMASAATIEVMGGIPALHRWDRQRFRPTMRP